MQKKFISLALISLACSLTTVLPNHKLSIKLQDKQLTVEKNIENTKTLDLVDIEKVNPNIILDIKYATADNILEKVLYSSAKCYFRKHVVGQLDRLKCCVDSVDVSGAMECQHRC